MTLLFWKRTNLALLLALTPVTVPFLSAQELGRASIELNGASVRIDFTAPAGTAPTAFVLERSFTLQPDTWLPDAGATFTAQGGTAYRVTTTRPAEGKFFYRVSLDNQPITVDFGSEPITVTEAAAGGIPVNFASPVTGTIPYVVSFSDGTSFSGSVDLTNASSTVLPFNQPDDFTPGGARFATLTILPDAIGGGTTSFSIEDDDEIWDGLIKTEDGGELAFCIERLRYLGVDYVRLINPDGTNFLPVGNGLYYLPITFSASSISLYVESATLPASKSPLGVPSFYSITVTGVPRIGSEGKVFEGTTVGNASLRRIVGATTMTYEPNESVASAGNLGAFSPTSSIVEYLAVDSAGDNDYFLLTGSGSTAPRIRLEFTHANGDLDLQLLDASGQVLAASTGVTNSEEIATTLAEGEVKYIRVYGFQNAVGSYRLLIGNGTAPVAPADVSHLSTTRPATFMMTKRAQPAADRKATLFDAP
jgi:hypothetical protein